MSESAKKIAALEAEIATLSTENSALKLELARHKPAPLPPPKIDGPFQLPSDKQLAHLISIALSKWPTLQVPERDISTDLFFRMVRNSMYYLGTLPRIRGALTKTHSYTSWIYNAQDFLRMNFKDSDVRGSSLFVAALVCNDICHSRVEFFPRVELGLVPVGCAENTYSASNKWLRLLQGDLFDESLNIDFCDREWSPIANRVDLTRSAQRSSVTAWRM
jgi:hypothetical protein